jgi:GPH family glycoside/pentoside/hexuronide:cation symporter
MPIEKLPFKKQISYACGMIGWSIMTNLVIVMLDYFYLPPKGSGLIQLLPQFLLFGVVNIMSVIAASGRLVDAFFDPFIASQTDRSVNPKGRRMPFMKWAILPAVIFCCLAFLPPQHSESMHNAWWLMMVLAAFFVSVTTYIIPYNALLPELTDTTAEKVKLSSFQQVGFVIGIILSALVNNYADLVQKYAHVVSRDSAVQYSIWGLAIVGGLTMLIPIISIDERRFVVVNHPVHLPVWQSIQKTFRQRNFIYYLVSDFSYYMALSIISSGLLYFVTVLLNLSASIGGLLMLVMVLGSLVFYPLVNYLTKRLGKKPLVLISFGILSIIFAIIYFLGKFPFSPKVQIFTLALMATFPLAALGILPNAILAEIADRDARVTGENREGMFFAVKFLFVKLAQTLGLGLFAYLTIYGKDPGNDFGLRLNGVCGFVLCLVALIVFSRFREKKLNNQRN